MFANHCARLVKSELCLTQAEICSRDEAIKCYSNRQCIVFLGGEKAPRLAHSDKYPQHGDIAGQEVVEASGRPVQPSRHLKLLSNFLQNDL